EIEFGAGEECEGDVGDFEMVLDGDGPGANVFPGDVGEVGPDVGGAETVGVTGLDEDAGAFEGLVDGFAAVVDAGDEVGVDVDAVGHESVNFEVVGNPAAALALRCGVAVREASRRRRRVKSPSR